MMKICLMSLLIASCFLSIGQGIHAQEQFPSIYNFTVKTIDGKEQSLGEFKGKTVLIVNTASLCGYTHQYKGLEELYNQFKGQGFVILAFPENNFLNQEPGSNEEIKKFCELKFHVTFPVFSKISVNGGDIAPLYKYLTTQSGFNGPITWNFNKFLVNAKGQVAARFGSDVDPLDPHLVEVLKQNLPSKTGNSL